MMVAGSHRENNPHRYKKSPLRGDKNREKAAGRKRVGKVYREKGPKSISLSTDDAEQDFTSTEMKVLYVLVKRGNFGDNSADLAELAIVRGVSKPKVKDFIDTFGNKLEHRDWGEVYIGEDGNHYVSLDISKEHLIRLYLEQNGYI